MFHRLVALLAVALASAPALAQQSTLYEGGKVFTARDDRPFVEAFVVRGGKVAATGSTGDLRLLFPHARRVDLKGMTVVPTLNDSHAHVAKLTDERFIVGPHPSTWAPDGGPTVQEWVVYISERAAQSPAGTPIVGYYGRRLYEDLNAMGVTARDFLDSITTQHPVVLLEWSGHASASNSAALDAADIRDFQPDPFGGWGGRDDTGRLTGVLQEYAILPLVRYLSRMVPDAHYVSQYGGWVAGAESVGVGETHDYIFVDEGERFAPVIQQLPRPDAIVPHCIITRAGQQCAPGPDGIIRRKVFSDGTQVACSAYVTAAYLRPEWCPTGFDVNAGYGIKNLTDAQMDWAIDDTLQRGGMLSVHAIGDAGIEHILSRLEARPGVNWKGKVSIEHFNVTGESHVKRAKRLKVSISGMGTHQFLIPSMMVEQHPGHLHTHALKLRSLLTPELDDDGVTVLEPLTLALGSDAFGPHAPSPWLDAMFLVTAPFNPTEALSMEQVVRAYTRGTAEARLRADVGVLAAGKRANFAVLSQDVFAVTPDKLPKTGSVLTVIDGAVRWNTGVLDLSVP
ncbi:amidohydrolase [Myxococcus virescens]|uniref:Amidohydrolase n=1 Tax=Myxococcus virescens TaxID=83456 RepID=A0A511HQ30_9BACT|nr:amidohydrolase family protein [Myxococcus virescens]GEL75464.1 amidohydrolase [Myxococcus virescens]SDE53622.1 hypothetical protein SAMN04488504_108103 [Myxococcus virescens]